MQALVGLALVGGAAWLGRRGGRLGGLYSPLDRRFADETHDIGLDTIDASDDALRWYEYEADDNGVDPCLVPKKGIPNPYPKALDALKKARKWQRKTRTHHAKLMKFCPRHVRIKYYVSESWGADIEDTPNTPCETWAAGLQWIDDAFGRLDDARNVHQRACPSAEPFPKASEQSLDGLGDAKDDRAYRNLVENRRLFNEKVDAGECQLSFPTVPLSRAL